VDIFRADFCAAFCDVAIADVSFVFEKLETVCFIHITDNAIIPLKERVVDEFYDPLGKMIRGVLGVDKKKKKKTTTAK
jgi:hypothetical protein